MIDGHAAAFGQSRRERHSGPQIPRAPPRPALARESMPTYVIGPDDVLLVVFWREKSSRRRSSFDPMAVFRCRFSTTWWRLVARPRSFGSRSSRAQPVPGRTERHRRGEGKPQPESIHHGQRRTSGAVLADGTNNRRCNSSPWPAASRSSPIRKTLSSCVQVNGRQVSFGVDYHSILRRQNLEQNLDLATRRHGLGAVGGTCAKTPEDRVRARCFSGRLVAILSPRESAPPRARASTRAATLVLPSSALPIPRLADSPDRK